METIAAHEGDLLRYAYGKLKSIKGISLYGPTDALHEKVGVITFNVDGLDHALTAAILSVEGGIGVRNGCFCAHPYVKELLHVSPEDDRRLRAEVLSGDKSNMPGMVRASFGCYSNVADVDALVEMLGRITRGEYRGRYLQERSSGAFSAVGYAPSFADYFAYAGLTGPVSQRPSSEAT